MSEIYNQTGVIDNAQDGIYGSVEGKIRSIASDFEDFEYMFADYAQANVTLDTIEKPTILYLLPPSGDLYFNATRRNVTDRPRVQIWFVCPSDFDFKSDENECRVEAMKRAAIRFIDSVNKSGMFEMVEGKVPYKVAYDIFDDNLTGVCIEPELIELDGIRLCDTTYSRK